MCSAIARWSYKATATIKPFVSMGDWGGGATYGQEYTIACNWVAETEQYRTGDGAEFVSRHVIFTEDLRPKKLDMIQFGGSDGWEEIRDRTEWDMSPFGDTPDVKLVT